MDPDPDPAIFVIYLQDANKKPTFYFIFFTFFFKDKESQNSRNQGLSYYFCMMIEGSRSGSGSIPLTNGSGSGSRRPKNLWIRIRNTAQFPFLYATSWLLITNRGYWRGQRRPPLPQLCSVWRRCGGGGRRRASSAGADTPALWPRSPRRRSTSGCLSPSVLHQTFPACARKKNSVVNTWNFGTDPDPGIHTSD